MMTTVIFAKLLNLSSVMEYSDGLNGTGLEIVTASLSSQVNVEPNGFVSDEPSLAALVSLEVSVVDDCSELDAEVSELDSEVLELDV